MPPCLDMGRFCGLWPGCRWDKVRALGVLLAGAEIVGECCKRLRPSVPPVSHGQKKKGLAVKPTPCFILAGGRGFEPRLAESESAVLPLDDPPKVLRIIAAAARGCQMGGDFVGPLQKKCCENVASLPDGCYK